MARIAVAVIATLVVVQFCCPPPALALERPAEPMTCPITGETCETKSADCDTPPQLTAAPAPERPAIAPDVASLPPSPELPQPHESQPALLDHWSAPNRTVVLRI